MKFKYVLFIFICLFVINPYNVSAEKIYSSYKFDAYNASGRFLVEYDIDTQKYRFGTSSDYGETVFNYDGVDYTMDDYNEGSTTVGASKYHFYLNEYPVKLNKGESLELYVCSSDFSGGGQVSQGTRDLYVFYDELHMESVYKADKIQSDFDKFLNGEHECKTIDSFEVQSGKAQKVSKCYSLDNWLGSVDVLLAEYKNSSSISALRDANQKIQQVKELCSTITKYADYGTNCMTGCLNLSETLKTIKTKYGIETDSGDGECGISQKLALYISNIVKWAKYIIPVIVIVLGILDFIKAISADKDDEMKKAQGRFVKRLIAAALIFIIPFILEFVLDKMGFGEYISGCGIDVGL